MPWLFYFIVVCTMTTGTLFLMWIGEQISEHGIGNGMSLIITIGIVSALPRAIGVILSQLNLDSQEPGQISFAEIIVFEWQKLPRLKKILIGAFFIFTIAYHIFGI